MLTGRQLKAARALLGLHRSKLAERMGIRNSIIKMAESTDGECPVTLRRANAIQRYLESKGIEFLPEGSVPAARFVPAVVQA